MKEMIVNNNIMFLDSKDVMAIMRISRPTLSRWVSKGIIPSIKIGGQLRFPREYFERRIKETLESYESNQLNR
jgi:excisionase family DNA binding protein